MIFLSYEACLGVQDEMDSQNFCEILRMTEGRMTGWRMIDGEGWYMVSKKVNEDVGEIFFFDPLERSILRVGILLLGIEIGVMVCLFILDFSLFERLLVLVSTALMAGRMGSIPVGLSLGFNPLQLTFILFVVNSVWLSVFYPVWLLVFSGVNKNKVLNNVLSAPSRVAQLQKEKVMRFGLVGLFIFVWLPFPWTGSLLGAIIGRLVGLSTKKIMVTVIPAILVAIFSWSLGLEKCFGLVAARIEDYSFFVIIGTVIFSLLIKYYFMSRMRKKDRI